MRPSASAFGLRAAADRFGRAGIAWVMMFVGLSAGSCRRTGSVVMPPRLGLGQIEVREIVTEGRAGAGLDTVAIAALTRRALLGSGLVEGRSFDARPTPQAEVRANITVGVESAEVGQKGVVRAGVRVRLDTRPSDAPGAVDEELSAGGEQIYEVSSEDARRRLTQQLAERTIADLLAGFVARARLRTAPAAEVHAAIAGQAQADGGSPALREEAIRVAGARGMRQEVPVLLPLLQSESEALRDAALGALIALRERRAVTELTRSRSLRDRHEMRKILEAIAILGGDEARDYLSFVAESHDDQEIRELATEAKGRLERHHDR